MMVQYRFSLCAADGQPLYASTAYPLYAWILSQIPSAYGTRLHEQSQKPVSQYLFRQSGKCIWTVSCLDEEIHEILKPVLQNPGEIPLRTGTVQAMLLDVHSVQSVGELMDRAENQMNKPFIRLTFRSPTAFKHDGKYIIFPEKHFIIQSLAEKWGSVYPDFPVSDPDALETIRQGVKMTDYHLQSCRFSMKNTRIPGLPGK